MHFIVPTDFSSTASKALEFALALANNCDGRITLLNCFDLDNMPSSFEGDNSVEGEAEVMGRLTQLRNEISNRYPDIKMSLVARFGQLSNIIPLISEEIDADCIVMGTIGAGSVSNKLFGSNTSKIVESTRIPLFVVPDGIEPSGFAQSAFSWDLKAIRKGKSLTFLEQLCTDLGTHMTAVHVASSQLSGEEVLEEELRKYLNYQDLNLRVIIGGDIVQGLDQYIQESKLDWLIMITRKRSLFGQLFSKSISKKMAHHGAIPTLILKEE